MNRTLAILFVLLVPAGLGARDLEIFVGARGGLVFSHGFLDQFDDRTVASPHVGLAFEVVDDLLVEVSYASMRAEGTVFSDFATQWDAHAGEVGLRYVVPVLPWLRPYARLTGGVLVESYSMDGPALDVGAKHVGFEVLPLVGVEVLWPTEALASNHGLFDKATGGVYFEVGYRYALPFDVGSRTPDGTFAGATARPLDLGAFDVQGLVLGGGFIGHF